MKLRTVLALFCAALLLVPAAYADTTATMNISGDVETNTTFAFSTTEVSGGDDIEENKLINDGRTHIKFAGRLEGDNGWFAAALGDAMISTAGTTGVDDAWVQFGTSAFAVKVGRYEAESLMGKGEDVYIAGAPGAPSRYQGDYGRGRFGGTLAAVGLEFGATENMTFYIDMPLGGDDGSDPIIVTSTDPNTGQVTTRVVQLAFGQNVFGARPVFKYSGDLLTVKIGGEFVTRVPQNDTYCDDDYCGDNNAQENRMGGAVDVSGTFGSISAGAAFAYGAIETTGIDDVEENDQTTMSTFGWATIPVGEAHALGLGLGYTAYEEDTATEDSMFETYVSFIQQLPVEGLKIKYAGSFASADIEPDGGSSTTNSTFGVRVRLNYDF